VSGFRARLSGLIAVMVAACGALCTFHDAFWSGLLMLSAAGWMVASAHRVNRLGRPTSVAVAERVIDQLRAARAERKRLMDAAQGGPHRGAGPAAAIDRAFVSPWFAIVPSDGGAPRTVIFRDELPETLWRRLIQELQALSDDRVPPLTVASKLL